MPAAYTGYKFKKLFGLVLAIMFLLAILSVINPLKSEAKDEIVEEVSEYDESGDIEKSYNILKSVPDPKGKVEQKSGNFFMNLLENNIASFIGLSLIITALLFVLGVRLKSVRSYKNSLVKRTRGI